MTRTNTHELDTHIDLVGYGMNICMRVESTRSYQRDNAPKYNSSNPQYQIPFIQPHTLQGTCL